MTKRVFSVLALGAGLALGGVTMAQDQPGRDGSKPGAGATGRPDGAAGQGTHELGKSGEKTRAGGQQADQQISQQLQEIAKDPKTAGDKLFLLSAALHSEWEHQFSQQAQQKAQDPQVKQLAERMVQDHQRLNDQLKQTAQKLGMQIPQGLPQMKQQELQIKASLPGEQFDKHYIAAMQAAHAHDVAAFQSASQIAQDDSVKQFASQSLATLQQHQQEVSRTATALGLSSGMEAVPAGGRMTPATPGAPGGGLQPNQNRGDQKPGNIERGDQKPGNIDRGDQKPGDQGAGR